MNEGLFTHAEVRIAIRKLASGKTSRGDDPPIECYKALQNEPGEQFAQLVDVFNHCFAHHVIPGDWLRARVAMIFKKGDPSLCQNYRPICVGSTAYKIYATLLKQRLLESGIDSFLWKSQFGFRCNRSIEDAIYSARRHIELACAHKGGRVSLLALDWARAFDAVNIESVLDALRRLGITGSFLNVIASLLHGRMFFVSDRGHHSDDRCQRSGITQGCTLSPLIFICMMSVLMADAVALLSPAARAAYARGHLADLAYADDTLLLGVSSDMVSEFLNAVAAAGARYGMSLHYGKLQLTQVGGNQSIRLPTGVALEPKESIEYLGTVLAGDGKFSSELGRRIGRAKGDFDALCRVWRHSTISRRRKLELYTSLIESRLLYGLTGVWLKKADCRRLDGFHARCLRTILKIRPAFYSRVSNADVLASAERPRASLLLLRRQLIHLGKIIRSSPDEVLRNVSFMRDTMVPATAAYIRKVGRPRLEWIPCVMSEALRITGGSLANLNERVACHDTWKSFVNRSIS